MLVALVNADKGCADDGGHVAEGVVILAFVFERAGARVVDGGVDAEGVFREVDVGLVDPDAAACGGLWR